MRNEYAGRKVIAWGATSHFVHDAHTINTIGARFVGQDRYVATGHHLRAALGTDSYAVGFLAAEGTYGWPERATPAAIPLPPAGSIEALWARTNVNLGFIDLRHLTGSGSWLRGPLQAGFMGYAPYRADWTRVLDGMFFTRTMTPSIAASE
jgi:erythromycin esterase-like protein